MSYPRKFIWQNYHAMSLIIYLSHLLWAPLHKRFSEWCSYDPYICSRLQRFCLCPVSSSKQNSTWTENFTVNSFVVGYHTLYDWYRSMESEHFPDPTGLRARLEQWTLGLYPACIKYLMSAFDVPEVTSVSAWKQLQFPCTFWIVYLQCISLFRSWLWQELISARMGWCLFLGVFWWCTTLLCLSTSGFSQLQLSPSYLVVTYISASTGSTYTLMKPSLRCVLQTTNHSQDSTLRRMVTWKYSRLQ